jgi:hypothetical protein
VVIGTDCTGSCKCNYGLFDENGKFQSFGYEAEEAYTRLLEDGGADGHSYFSSFKMKLFQDEDSKELVHPILKVLR